MHRVATMILATVALALLSGCATIPGPYGPAPLDPPFWKQEPRPLEVVLLPAPPGGVFRTGGDPLLHAVITDARDKELIDFVATSSPDFEWLVDRFAALFAARGFPVARLDARDLEIGDARDGFGAASAALPSTVRATAPGAGPTELLLVIAPGSWGLARHYEFGAVPIGAHYASFDVVVELWDLPNRTKLWSGSGSGSAALPRQWNEPPDHPKVRASLEQALQASGDGVAGSLEAWDGTKAALVYPLPTSGEK